jgi:capsular exopolysaccharide synthesis family protein
MSRVYDALQQCCPDQVYTSPVQGDNGRSLFIEPTHDSVWEPDSAPIASFSTDERIPALFSAYGFASEQFRLLATRLQQMQQKGALKSILLTSSVAQEGKSLLTVNLAMALAQGARSKILVVEADLRNSGACRTLRMEERSGIRDWYHSNRPITDFICRLDGLNVWVLPAGREPVDPLELLKSPRMAKLLNEMSGAFDWLLIDSTPLLPIADAEVLSRIADGTIVVVRRDKGFKTELKQALARVAPSKMIGLLLNDFPATADYPESYTVGKHSDGPGTGRQSNRFKGFKTELKQTLARVAPSKMIGLRLQNFRAFAHYVSRALWESVRTVIELASKRTRFESFKTELEQALARVAPSKMIGLRLNNFPAVVGSHSAGKRTDRS